jgi:glutamate-1-semialdehyde 2,1-aminomutase
MRNLYWSLESGWLMGNRVTSESRALQTRAEGLFPGGVNSPVRGFRSVGGEPPFVARAEGAYLYDADGNRYLDYFGSWGPMILGHAFGPAVAAIQRAATNSSSFGASTRAEGDLAELVMACYPAIERMRFVSSGTEATMSAIRVARAATGRKRIIKFEGCYHGHSDGLLVKAGSGVATLGIPGSAGVPEEIAQLTMALPYNDLPAVEAAFLDFPDEIAAIILEPVVGNAGCIAPAAGYLAGLRKATSDNGALLIVDEVMTGFRLALGGALELYSVDADLVTLGKIIGGGLPCGAFGGKREFMDLLAPLGTVYPRLEATAKAVAEGVAAEAAKAGVPVTLNRVGSMWTWFFTGSPVADYEQAAKSDTAAFGRFHHAMLESGIWLPPSQFEAMFLGTAHGPVEVEATVAAAAAAFATAAQAV